MFSVCVLCDDYTWCVYVRVGESMLGIRERERMCIGLRYGVCVRIYVQCLFCVHGVSVCMCVCVLGVLVSVSVWRDCVCVVCFCVYEG